jgi:hypothetical protein
MRLILCIREAVPARSAGLTTALVGLFAWLGMGSGGYRFDAKGGYVVSFAGAAAAGMAHLAVVAALGAVLWWRGCPRGACIPPLKPVPA